MKKSVLILSEVQFGYLTDTLKYSEYASDEFYITYIGWDCNKKKIEMPGVNVRYITRGSNWLERNIRLLRAFHKEIKLGYDLIFVNYRPGISIVKLFNLRSNFVLDIRTLAVNPKLVVRFLRNLLLRVEILFFKRISLVSDGVAKILKLKNYDILPLGGGCFSSQDKSFENLSFLYVGTLYNRQIIDCVVGFHLFIEGRDAGKPLPVFTIIGDSQSYELSEIRKYIVDNKLENQIKALGEVPHNELHSFFENCNVGISYIPRLSYYEYQPSTKTFEYLNSGLPVIGTSTFENKKVIGEHAGVLIEDNSKSFLEGIHKMYAKKDSFSSTQIKNIFPESTWEWVVENKFVSLVKKWCE